MIISVLFQSYF